MCSSGVLTIGYGHNLDNGISDNAARLMLDEALKSAPERHYMAAFKPNGLYIAYGFDLNSGISEAAALHILQEDINIASDLLDKNADWWRHAPWAAQTVMLDMCFNMGWGTGKGGLSSIKSFLDAMQRSQYRAAADMLWLPGLPAAEQRYKYARDVKDRARLNAELLRGTNAQ